MGILWITRHSSSPPVTQLTKQAPCCIQSPGYDDLCISHLVLTILRAYQINKPKWDAWKMLPEAVQQGEVAFALAHGGFDMHQVS